MVGLSVVLESQKSGFSNKTPQVINKATMVINKPSPSSSSSSSFPVPSFLQQCFLCQQKLLPGEDIYMYKDLFFLCICRGDRAFCSVECRCRQIFMDEEETLRKENCSLTAIKPTSASSPSSSTTSRHRKSNRNPPAGGFAY
ncbi:hypothetical protein K2173_022409 [Erythroxylum novogranatense]|uniref:FLZ-type domain-containing protein n=1 Tax=Erythroxylum novogranatense TaxID=1862640 RepID=A0AAV8TK04_9ROSI|nr:hypothetical protein K2173_022409 [Erythroxylum novogranatense]